MVDRLRKELAALFIVALVACGLTISFTPGPASVAEGVTLNDPWRLPVNIHLELLGSDGAVKDERWVHNLVTTAGKDAASQRILDAASTPSIFNYVGVGDGNGSGTCSSAAAGDTALGSELGTRQQDTDSDHGTTGKETLIVTFAAGNGTGALCEMGVFNASSSGTLLARNVFSVINKGASDSLQITFSLTVSKLHDRGRGRILAWKARSNPRGTPHLLELAA